ncbi:hypothetical protein KOAAANKH_00765 [Brevundimonas sp. NIBR10]|uniref:fumarylacetoacetate hydrolase family protein n=1 Tax=Brevundimonas sp. NIBR10 TaxID=3015997 RepID=UPI0022F148C1|nr:fumarylacetoacetate hydrolase family protein [Brevundimonas sp. NIBR10]WGM45900.1 hypothetical protein KOAAANKH_00765 [Brevundimonas sp. NIBR10]
MAIQIVRYQSETGPAWAVHRQGGLIPLRGAFATTGAFITDGGLQAARALGADARATLRLDAVQILSPVTSDGDFICQASNYESHIREIGRTRADVLANVFFTKASSCLAPPDTPIVRPAHVRLLDYEVELGLVIGRPVTGPVLVTPANLADYVVGWVITNDVSARDVQVSHEQFHKAKSYRTFGPTGPFLVVPEAGESLRWADLVLQLKVNGGVRQRAQASEMLFDPYQTLTELSQIRDLKPGDLIATGTPAGVAIKAPSKLKIALAGFLPARARFAAFLKSQSGVEAYLQPGDVVETSIASSDGALDLGTQRNLVTAA